MKIYNHNYNNVLNDVLSYYEKTNNLLKADVYLLDEPTSALDEDTEMMILEYFIREIKKKQASLLMITHSNTVNEQFAEERIYLSQSNGQ